MTPIKKLSVSAVQCESSCQNISDCTSLNFNYQWEKENCELLSENAYGNFTNLVSRSGWLHYTTYVSSMLFDFTKFFFVFFFAFAICSKILKLNYTSFGCM